MLLRPLLLTLLLSGFLFTPFAAGEPTGCNVRTQVSTALPSGYYVVPVRNFEIWKESNDLPGLQIGSTLCDGGFRVPEDTCIVAGHTSGGVFWLSQCIDAIRQDPGSILP